MFDGFYVLAMLPSASRPTATVRLGDEEWLDDRVNGRPEVWYSNQWGTVCGLDSHGWTWADGELLCQQYGLSGRIEHGTVGDYGNINPGTGRVWLDYLTCSSYYDWISQCSHNGWGASSACTHANDGAVSCRSESCHCCDYPLCVKFVLCVFRVIV